MRYLPTVLAAVLGTLSKSDSYGQSYPNIVSTVVPFPAGGAAAVVARMVAYYPEGSFVQLVGRTHCFVLSAMQNAIAAAR